MYIERDSEFDQLYISFLHRPEEGTVAETVEVAPGISVDMDAGGKLIGVEITSAKAVIGTPASEIDFSGELAGVKEAAELAGKDKANFLRDLASRDDFPKPVARLASGRYWLSAEIERYLRKERIAG